MFVKTKVEATSVEDIFKILGDKAAREFITSKVHTIDPKMASNKVPGYLSNLHYGYHKDLGTYADLALERFNNGRN